MLLTINTKYMKRTSKSTLYTAKSLYEVPWIWQDQQGRTHNATAVFTNRQSQKANDRIYFRLDVPSSPTIDPSYTPKYLWPVAKPDDVSNGGSVPRAKKKPPIKYDLEPYLKCSQLEQNLTIDHHHHHHHHTINNPQPDTLKPKVGACITRFWGQHDLLPEWMVYHRMIGINHFWFFVGEPWENMLNSTGLPRYNQSDITYVPYHYRWSRYRHKRPPLVAGKISNNNLFQAAITNQCLYHARQHGVEWIIAPDLDEYMVLHEMGANSSRSGVSSESSSGSGSSSDSPLDHFLSGYPEVGQVCLTGVAFGRHKSLEPLMERDGNQSKIQLTIDFTYRGNKSLPARGGRQKCFYRTNVVNDAWIHNARDGGKLVKANSSQIELYHYRTPLLGVFNEDRKIFRDERDLVSYPEIRDRYHDQIIRTLYESNWFFPNFTNHVDTGHGEYLYEKKQQQQEQQREVDHEQEANRLVGTLREAHGGRILPSDSVVDDAATATRQQDRPDYSKDYPPASSENSCAILFMGLPRSYRSLVLPSIIRNVLPHNPHCDYFVHTYNKTHENKGRTGAGGQLAPTEVFLLKDALLQRSLVHNTTTTRPSSTIQFLFENEEQFSEARGPVLDKIFTTKDDRGDLVYVNRHFGKETTLNIVKQWHSIQSVWQLMERAERERGGKAYTTATVLRSDVVFLTPVQVPRASTRSVTVPGFALWPVNDRFISGDRDAVEVWANRRFALLDKYVSTEQWQQKPGHGIHPESFLAWTVFPTLLQSNFSIHQHPSLCFLRARPGDVVWTNDCFTGKKEKRTPVESAEMRAIYKGRDMKAMVEQMLERECKRSPGGAKWHKDLTCSPPENGTSVVAEPAIS